MDQHTRKPNWSLTVWAIAGFAILMFAVSVVGGTDPELAATIEKPVG